MVLEKQDLENVIQDIDNANQLDEKSEIIMKARESIFDVLANNIAEFDGYAEDENTLRQWDQDTLEILKEKLEQTRDDFSNDLGKVW